MNQSPESDMPRLAQALLVLRCQAGDEAAFAALMNRFAPATHGYLRSLVGDDADDVQQEAWLTVYRTIRGLADPAAFRSWLFRVARHRAIDLLRRQAREGQLIDSAPVDVDGIAASAADDDGDTVDARLLDGALDGLPPLQREVILLRYRDELSYAEMALVIGCPIGTVRTRLHHARAKLHLRLKDTLP